MANAPAETTVTPLLSRSSGATPSFLAIATRASDSAMGERQVFPLQTKRMVVLSMRSMILSS